MSWSMINFSITLLVTQVLLIYAQDDDKNFYSKRYDSIDVDTIFRSSRLLNNYVDCLLDKKPCPPEGKDLKRVLPQALRSKCSRCTKIQKAKALDVITRLYYHHPSMYLSLAELYDPTGEYTRNFEQWYENEYRDKPNSQLQINEVPQKSRIPSTWITKATTTPRTIQTTTTSRPTLRTLPTTLKMKILPTEAPVAIPIILTTSERPILPPRTTTTTTTQRTTTERLTSSSTVEVVPLERKVEQYPIPVIQRFDPPANQQFVPLDNQQFTPQNQQVPQTVNFAQPISPPQPINPQVPQLLPQQPVIQTISSTFSTNTEQPSPIVTNPSTSSFRPIQQSSTDIVSSSGVNTVSAVFASGNLPSITTSQIPLPLPPIPAVQPQITSVPSTLVQQVPSNINFQPSSLTSTFGTPLAPNINSNLPRQQPISQIDPNFIDNFFVPRGGLIRRSVDQILDTTRGVMRALFRFY